MRITGKPISDANFFPCLASRIPYGTAVDPEVLARIDRAELAVKVLGYPVLRVRHHGATGKVELTEEALAALTPERRAAITRAVASAGYDEVEISDEPFRSGSLNASFTRRLLVAS